MPGRRVDVRGKHNSALVSMQHIDFEEAQIRLNKQGHRLHLSLSRSEQRSAVGGLWSKSGLQRICGTCMKTLCLQVGFEQVP